MLFKLNEPILGIEPVEWERSIVAPEAADELTALGFGAIDSDNNLNPPLLKADAVEAGRVCSQSCKGSLDNDSMFCTGNGDVQYFYLNSGGPIVNGKNVQVGIKAWGGHCTGERDVYTRVGVYAEWIEADVCNLSEDASSLPFCFIGDSKVEETNEPKEVPQGAAPSGITCTTSSLPGGCTALATSDYKHLCGFVDSALECPVKFGTCETRVAINCEEDQAGDNLLADLLREHDCAWLERVLLLTHHVAFVCERFEVAFHCPKTCNTCENNANGDAPEAW